MQNAELKPNLWGSGGWFHLSALSQKQTLNATYHQQEKKRGTSGVF